MKAEIILDGVCVCVCVCVCMYVCMCGLGVGVWLAELEFFLFLSGVASGETVRHSTVLILAIG